MQGVFERGTAKSATAHGYRGGAAGKTGTTDDTRDAWFVGYTPETLALTWVGYDDNARTGLSGATAALPIWVDVMRRAGAADTVAEFEPPLGVIRRRVDPSTGRLAVRGCPQTVDEWFARGSEPTRPCPNHRGGVRGWLRKVFTRDATD